jgi:hypothetical protein
VVKVDVQLAAQGQDALSCVLARHEASFNELSEAKQILEHTRLAMGKQA